MTNAERAIVMEAWLFTHHDEGDITRVVYIEQHLAAVRHEAWLAERGHPV